MKLAVLAIIVTALVSRTKAHGLMSEPPQRGVLAGHKLAPRMKNIIKDAPTDFFAHFPSGSKRTTPGAGKHSQEKEGNGKWTPFEPLNKGFRWRAGVCGDLRSGPGEHLRGGRYYFDGRVTRSYPEGGIVKVGMSIVAHHNGFIEMHVCDVKRCGGEISETCFRKGHCQLLRRARNPTCDNGMSRNCAPIDGNYPGRWYLPCSNHPGPGVDLYEEDYARFVLPNRLTCEHCVLQWFWTSANNCNPPGVVEYFDGPDGPKNWGTCAGQGGAIGGRTKVQKPCGGKNFPEEYYQCADIRITNDNARSGRGKFGTAVINTEPKYSINSSPSQPSQQPKADQKKATNEKRMSNKKKVQKEESRSNGNKNDSSRSPFKTVKLFEDGRLTRKVFPKVTFKNINSKKLTFKVVTYREVKSVEFFIDGKKVWTEHSSPYFLFGNSGNMAYYWPSPIFNRRFMLEVRAEGYSYKASVQIVRKK